MTICIYIHVEVRTEDVAPQNSKVMTFGEAMKKFTRSVAFNFQGFYHL